MSSQQFKANLLAVSLFMTSVGGTFAIFACVPMLARLTSSTPEATPTQLQAFPKVSDPKISNPNVSERPGSSKSAAITSLSYRSQQARAIFNSWKIKHEQTSPARSAQ